MTHKKARKAPGSCATQESSMHRACSMYRQTSANISMLQVDLVPLHTQMHVHAHVHAHMHLRIYIYVPRTFRVYLALGLATAKQWTPRLFIEVIPHPEAMMILHAISYPTDRPLSLSVRVFHDLKTHRKPTQLESVSYETACNSDSHVVVQYLCAGACSFASRRRICPVCTVMPGLAKDTQTIENAPTRLCPGSFRLSRTT